MKKDKLTKHDFKRLLPKELYLDAKKGKRGKYDNMLKSVNTRLSNESYSEFMEFLKTLGVKRSNFVRYAIENYMSEVKDLLNNELEKE